MKILNLYAGIGGNRKLWTPKGDEHEITAIEYKQDIADIYKDLYPNDTIIVGDAHEYLLKHYKEFDFIWSSPPCPSHSDIRRCGVAGGRYDAVYPEMGLYQEIILLQKFSRGLFIVENVKPYYDPLIKPTVIMHRHCFWSNFHIGKIEMNDDRRHSDINGGSTVYGFQLGEYKAKNKRKILRNMVNPALGMHVLNEAMGVKV